jgi:hypothetical protein
MLRSIEVLSSYLYRDRSINNISQLAVRMLLAFPDERKKLALKSDPNTVEYFP